MRKEVLVVTSLVFLVIAILGVSIVTAGFFDFFKKDVRKSPRICEGLKMIINESVQVPYSYVTDSCGGYRCVFSDSLVVNFCFSDLTSCSSACAGGVSGGACVNVSEAKTECSTSCSDSDGGKNIYVKGTTSFTNSSGSINYGADACLTQITPDVYRVTEWYCDGNTRIKEFINCPSGYICSNGACLSSTPKCSDFGYTSGEVGALCSGGVNYDLSGCKNVTNTCIDNDGGAVYFTASNVSVSTSFKIGPNCFGSGSGSGGGSITSDSCNGNYVVERICNADNTVGYVTYPCQNGCSGGACISGSLPGPGPAPGPTNQTNQTDVCTAQGGVDKTATISEGSSENVAGLDVRVDSADETNLIISAILTINEEKVFLFSDSPKQQVETNGILYYVELVAASDLDARIRISMYSCPYGCIDGVCVVKEDICTDSDGSIETKEINEGESKEIAGLNVELISADEDNLRIEAIVNVLLDDVSFIDVMLTSDDPTRNFYLEEMEYLVELVSATDISATIRVNSQINYNEKGIVEIKQFDGTIIGRDEDSCGGEVGKVLEETFCFSDGRGGNSKAYACPNGCVDGACVSEPVIEACDAVYLNTEVVKIFEGDSIDKARTVLGKVYLPEVLRDGEFSGDVFSDYVQSLELGSHPKIVYAKQPTSEDEPKYGVALSTNPENYLYKASVTFGRAVNLVHSNSKGEDINIFGKKFIISPETNGERLVLLESGKRLTLTDEEDSQDVVISGNKYTVQLISVSDGSANIRVYDNTGFSNAREIDESNYKSVTDLIVFVINTDENNLKLVADIVVGLDRIVLEDGLTVKKGIDESVVDGTRVHFQGGLSAMTKLSLDVAAPDSDSDAIVVGKDFVDSVFGTIRFVFVSYGEVNGAKILVKGCAVDKECVPEYFCKVEPATCPVSGRQEKICRDAKCNAPSYTEEVQCEPGECSGCEFEGRCLPYGIRLEVSGVSSYCDIDGRFEEQKRKLPNGNWAACQNNYECDSNVCSGGECVEINDAIREVGRFRGLVIRVLCRLAHLFNEAKYSSCIAEDLGYVGQ